MNTDITIFGIDAALWTVYATLIITTILVAVCATCSVLVEGEQVPSTERKQSSSRRTAL